MHEMYTAILEVDLDVAIVLEAANDNSPYTFMTHMVHVCVSRLQARITLSNISL